MPSLLSNHSFFFCPMIAINLGLNPGWLNVWHGVQSLNHFGNISQLRNYNAYVLAFLCLHFALSDTRVLNLLEELCITRVTAVNSFTWVNPWEGSVYIVILRQTVSLYHNSSVWMDMKDASSWNWNLADFTLDMVFHYLTCWVSDRPNAV